jgi:hypothetical protein
MSILDRFRRSAKKAKEQAGHVVDEHGDKIATGIEKTGGAVSKVTGHRFDDKIDKGVNKAKERLEQQDDSAETPPGPATTPGGPESSAAPEPTPAPPPATEPPPKASTTDEPPSDPRPGTGGAPTT